MVWIGLFFVLLFAVELYQSAKDVQLPLPVYLVLGAILAVASNYDRQILPSATSERVTLTEIPEPMPELLPQSETKPTIAPSPEV
jgi:hypothetical protein